MKVQIRRLDKQLPLPEYKTAGAAAMDLASREDVTCPPGEVTTVHLGIAVKPPRGHFALLAARSSLHKRGLMLANSIGIADEDYCGDNDEYQARLFNFSKEQIEIKRGERLLQMMVLPFDRVEWEEVETLSAPDRGGFGTTGTT